MAIALTVPLPRGATSVSHHLTYHLVAAFNEAIEKWCAERSQNFALDCVSKELPAAGCVSAVRVDATVVLYVTVETLFECALNHLLDDLYQRRRKTRPGLAC